MDAVEGETKRCSNCRNDIPVASVTLHEVHCSRKIAFCEQCNIAVNHSEWDEHHDQYHTFEPCSRCRTNVLKYDQERHSLEDCMYRKVTCDHCELEVLAKDLQSHESYCKTRTEYCHACETYINVQSFDDHECKPPERQETRSQSSPSIDDFDPFAMHGLDDSLDTESRRLLVSLQMQEMERLRYRNNSVNEDSTPEPAQRHQFGSISRENTLGTKTICPSCKEFIDFSEVERHSTTCPNSHSRMIPVETAMRPLPTRSRYDEIDHSPQFVTDPLFADETSVPDGPNPFQAQNRFVVDNSDSEPDLPGPSRPSAESEKIPCEFCAKMINFYDFENHVFECSTTENQDLGTEFRGEPLPTRNISTANESQEGETEKFPCEFCEESFPASELMSHQYTCTSRVRLAASDIREVNPRLAEDSDISRISETTNSFMFPPVLSERHTEEYARTSVVTDVVGNYGVRRNPIFDRDERDVRESPKSVSRYGEGHYGAESELERANYHKYPETRNRMEYGSSGTDLSKNWSRLEKRYEKPEEEKSSVRKKEPVTTRSITASKPTDFDFRVVESSRTSSKPPNSIPTGYLNSQTKPSNSVYLPQSESRPKPHDTRAKSYQVAHRTTTSFDYSAGQHLVSGGTTGSDVGTESSAGRPENESRPNPHGPRAKSYQDARRTTTSFDYSAGQHLVSGGTTGSDVGTESSAGRPEKRRRNPNLSQNGNLRRDPVTRHTPNGSSTRTTRQTKPDNSY